MIREYKGYRVDFSKDWTEQDEDKRNEKLCSDYERRQRRNENPTNYIKAKKNVTKIIRKRILDLLRTTDLNIVKEKTGISKNKLNLILKSKNINKNYYTDLLALTA